jgi:hypothetical protein|tara:strand:- start:38 stop:499 length:462 start_codon:yes stop_codon:yes gene_type:complete
MKKTITIISACLLTVAFVAPAVAADKKKKAPIAVKVPKGIELTADQKTKLDALNKEFGPKLAECRKKAASIITADQKKARAEATKKAKADGKKGKELRAAANTAVAITADQKAQQTECKKAMGALNKEVRTQFAALLTDEQKAKIKGGKKKNN